MYLEFWDWAIVVVLLVVMTLAAIRTKKYTTSVADFLVANRCAGRYLLAVSEGIAATGAITIVAWFEAYYKAGFSFAWWAMLLNLVMIIAALTGFVVYRYRQTRALTLAQFLEMRYSKNFRIFAGITMFISGTINFGIFPAVGARFFMYFCGLPNIPVSIGFREIDLMYALVMVVLLGVALFFTFMGGQIAVIVTDFLQGSVFNILLCIVIAFIFIKVPWSSFLEALATRPEGKSMIHPFQAGETTDFNYWYYIIGAIGIFYAMRAWQGNQGYFASARNAHEARMGAMLGSWRNLTQQMLILIVPITAFVIMRHPDFAVVAASATEILNGITDDTIRTQVTATAALSQFLPVGILGGFCAVMLAAFISTHDTYLHSWGCIFIQDVIMPFRKEPYEPKQHMKVLRRSILGVALFIFLFSLLFPQNDYIFMFFALTGTIWLGAAGAVIIGGLYWKRGTTTAAFTAMIVGITIAVGGFVCQRVFEEAFPVNAQWLWFIAMVCCSITYILVSLCGKRKHIAAGIEAAVVVGLMVVVAGFICHAKFDGFLVTYKWLSVITIACSYLTYMFVSRLGKKSVFNMDRMLHRGEYAVIDDKTAVSEVPVSGLRAIFGMGKDFNFKDKVIYMFLTGWSVGWAIFFLVVTFYNLFYTVSDETWARYWHFYIWMSLVIGIVTTICLTVGGLVDMKKMFHRLGTLARDSHDDGVVTHEADDVKVEDEDVTV